jgi:hypothetical protein
MECIPNLFVSVVFGHKISHTSADVSFDIISKLKAEYDGRVVLDVTNMMVTKVTYFSKIYHHVTFLGHH